MFANSVFELLNRVAAARLFGELVVKRRHDALLDLFNLNAKYGFPTCEILPIIILGECHVDLGLALRDKPAQRLVELRKKAASSEH